MKIARGKDLFTISEGKCDAICIPISGKIKADGRAEMDIGMAKKANDLFHLDYKLAKSMKESGSAVCNLGKYAYKNNEFAIITIPNDNNWEDDSDLESIEEDCKQLVKICNENKFDNIYMTLRFCGHRGLSWVLILKKIEPILDDRFTVIIQ